MRCGLALILVLTTASLEAQSATPTTTTPTTTTPTAHSADPYRDEEFAPWVLKLRRFEIITVGVFPIAYMFAGLGFDYYYYSANGFPSSNIPWPAGPGTSSWTTTSNPSDLQQKNLTILEMALVMSVGVAVADWILGL
jgi:hypothetical protein